MARPEKIKTPLGQRLTDVRKALGHETRAPFAELLGLPLETLGGYERGIREPDSSFMAMYNERFGINLTWLITGNGEMFISAANAPPSSKAVNTLLMRRLAAVSRAVHKETGVPAIGDAVISEATWLYNSLLKTVSDLSDNEEIEASLPKLRLSLKRQLQQQSMQQRVQENSR